MTSIGQSGGDTASAEQWCATSARASWENLLPFPRQHSTIPFGSALLPTFLCQQQEGWEDQPPGLGKEGAPMPKLQL